MKISFLLHVLAFLPNNSVMTTFGFSFSSIQSKTAANNNNNNHLTTQSSLSNSDVISLWAAARRKSSSVPEENSNNNADNESSNNNSDNNSNSASAIDPAKEAALLGVLNQIERAYGRGSIMRLGDDSSATNGGKFKMECISSGSLTLDIALGGNGYPRGRIVEIYGPESSGKTTLALHAIASVQKAHISQDGSKQRQGLYKGKAAFIDAEHALDPAYAAACGVDIDNLLVCQPDSGEMALDVVDQLVRSTAVDVIVVDSVAALVPRSELEGDMSDQSIGLQARLMSKAMRKITGSLARSGTATVIFINQLRSKIGVIYGSPEVTSGGNALKYYASIRLDTRRKEILSDNTGIRIQVKVVKNKIAAPFRVVMLDILFASGLDTMGCLLDVACDLDIMQRRGSWYAYQGVNVAQGRQNVVQWLRDNESTITTQLEQDVRQQLEAMRSTTSTTTTPSLSAKTTTTATSKDNNMNNNNDSMISSIMTESGIPALSSSSSSSSMEEEDSYL